MAAMLDTHQALAAAARSAPAPVHATPRRVLVVGGGGVLGAAVLEQLLASHRFAKVAALVDRPVQAAVKGFVALPDNDAALQEFGADTALLVFDAERHSHRREVAFVRPLPKGLPTLAARLQASGVCRLVVVVPHRAALLPMALQQGLATLDETAVAALGFEHLVFMRMAQGGMASAQSNPKSVRPGLVEGLAAGSQSAGPTAPQRLAAWMLSQLHWMVPQREQPVRAATVARVAAALALQLPGSTPGTRVLPAATLWHAAQQRHVQATVQAWLDGTALPAVAAQRPLRM